MITSPTYNDEKIDLSPLTEASDITRLLSAASANGLDRDSLNSLLPLVYAELRRIAAASMRSQPAGHTLQPTALIHEAYVRLLDRGIPEVKDRSHFFSLASKMMRQILVDHARKKQAQKRNLMFKVELSDASAATYPQDSLLEVHEALERLAAFSPRQAQILELRYFGGLDIAETAKALNCSTPTVVRDSRMAEAWLAREMSRQEK